MVITDAGPQVAASRSSPTTSPRPSSPSRLRMMMMMSLGWTSTWTPWKRHPTANLCPSPSTTWKVTDRFSACHLFNDVTLLPSRRPAASRCGIAASEGGPLQPQVQVRISDWFWSRSRPAWTGSPGAGGRGGQTGHQVALFFHRSPPPGELGQHECPAALPQGSVTRRYHLSVTSRSPGP